MKNTASIVSICTGFAGSLILVLGWFNQIPQPLTSVGFYLVGFNGGMWINNKLKNAAARED